MSKKLKLADTDGTAVHLHNDLHVTRARVEDFASADFDIQLGVLASLRSNADSQEATQVLAVQSMVVAVLAVLLTFAPGIVPHVKAIDYGPFWWLQFIAVSIGVVVLVVVAVIVVIPVLIDQSRFTRKRQQAVVWLGAYEDELARHRSSRGRAARRWRRTHPL
jgi:protein-S-isoprenylcysteine O-methyltransferase Ste14